MLWKSCQNRRDEVEKTSKWPPYELEQITLRGFGGVFETKHPVCRGQSGPKVDLRSSDKALLERKWNKTRAKVITKTGREKRTQQ